MEFYYHELRKDVVVLSADGGLNKQTADEFVDQLITVVDGGIRKLVVDCENLEYISTVGLSMLIRLHKRVREHDGDVKLCHLKGMIPGVLRVTHLDRLFGIHPNLEDAISSFAE